GGGLDPNCYFMAPVWLAERDRGPLSDFLSQMVIAGIQFNDDLRPRYANGHVNWYFQINADWGGSWRSRSMGEHTFPFDLVLFSATPLHDPRFEDTELEPGVPLRRVILKAPAARFQVVPGTHAPP